jgi:hypothetical protein
MAPGGANRLSLKDISPVTVSRLPPHTLPRPGDKSRKFAYDDPSSRTSGSNRSRRGSFTRMSMSHVPTPLRRFDSISLQRPHDESFKDELRDCLSEWWVTLVVMMVTIVQVVIYCLLRVGTVDWGWSKWPQLTLVGIMCLFAAEMCIRMYAFGVSYFSSWPSVLESFVVAVAFSLCWITPVAGAVCGGRIVCMVWREIELYYERLEASGGKTTGGWRRSSSSGKDGLGLTKAEADDKEFGAPSVQLYRLMSKTVSSSCNVFTVLEKRRLRNLMYLLAHHQIYVDMNMQRGNDAYWKEYGPQVRRHSSVGSDLVLPTPDSKKASQRGQLAMDNTLGSEVAEKIANGYGLGSSGSLSLTGGALASEEDSLFHWLTKADEWDFDAFQLDELSNGHPLVSLCNFLFDERRYNFFGHFKLSKRHFTNYVIQIEAGYGSGNWKGANNIYHNRRHAADVTQAVHYFLQTCGLGGSLTDIEMVSLLLSAIIHDFKHPGRSNAFLIKTQSELSLVYNDVSVLENFHVSEAFRVMRQDRCNFLRHVEPATVASMRDLIIPLVLATDLKFHFDHLGEFNSHLSDIQNEIREESKTRTYLSAMKICIKSADISHPTRAMYLHLMWTKALIEEFFLQGDEEKRRGLEVSPNCDRDNIAVADAQKGFINFLVKPLFKSWVSFLDCPCAQVCMTNLEFNESMWDGAKQRDEDILAALLPTAVKERDRQAAARMGSASSLVDVEPPFRLPFSSSGVHGSDEVATPQSVGPSSVATDPIGDEEEGFSPLETSKLSSDAL